MSDQDEPYCGACGLALHPQAEKAIGTGEWALVWADMGGSWVCSRTGNEHRPHQDERYFEVELTITVKMEGDEDAAYEAVDKIMQAHHDDALRPQNGLPWDYEMVQGCVTDVTKEHQP